MLRYVDQTYSAAAIRPVANLCCPPSYDARYLDVIPSEVIERDYGCGDPTPYVRAGETVLDLGSGAGKMCFVLAQVVGASGRVIGIDRNKDMLEVARRAAPIVAAQIECRNVEFRRTTLEDMDLDLEKIEEWLAGRPITSIDDLQDFEDYKAYLRKTCPPVADSSIGAVVSNCVLNLVPEAERPAMFATILRKLKPGGRVVLSDIVCDGPLPDELANDRSLRAACIAGAYQIDQFVAAMTQAGFVGARIAEIGPSWRSEAGVAFRSMTVTAARACDVTDAPSSVYAIYRGPWRSVEDERGRVYRRGDRVCLCTEEGRALLQHPYADEVTIWIGAKAIPGAAAWVDAVLAQSGGRTIDAPGHAAPAVACCSTVPTTTDGAQANACCA